MAHLSFRDAGGALHELELDEEQVLIGRVRDCHIRSSDGTLTRRHALVLREGGGWWVRDLGSNNGTWVNGVRVATRALQHGDRIQCGNLELCFAEHP